MVPLRSEYGEGKTSTWNEHRRPHLVLHDTTIAPPRPAQSCVRQRKPLRRWENLMLSLAVISVLLFFAASLLGFLWHTVASSYASSFGSPVPTVVRRVAPGDTLWRYAATYGDPNSYILDRVETIARDNHLSSSAPLVPGQVLHIAVHNPTLVAQLQRRHQSRLALRPLSSR